MTTIKKTSKATASNVSAPGTAPAAVAPANPLPPPAAGAPPVDPNAALEQYVAQTVAQLDTVEVGLGADPPLSPAQKRHAAKLRKGGDKIVGQIGNLVQQQQLDSTALNTADMLSVLGKAQALQPLADRLAAFAKHVNDVIFKAQSDSITMAQQFYAVLQRRAVANTELAAALAPVAAFFAYRHATVKAAGTPTRPQLKATKKALKTLKKQAPQLLAAGAGQGTTASAPLASAIPAQPTGQGGPVPAPVGGAGGNPAPGVVTSTPAAPGAATHS